MKNKISIKTKDNVFVIIKTLVQYHVDPAKLAAAYCKLSNLVEQIQSYIEDSIRNIVPGLDLN